MTVMAKHTLLFLKCQSLKYKITFALNGENFPLLFLVFSDNFILSTITMHEYFGLMYMKEKI